MNHQLAGYYLIDVANLDEAIAVATGIPGTTSGRIEIRPIVEKTSGIP
ncbi:MAG: YciI family protein [Pirellulaceae bacterium]